VQDTAQVMGSVGWPYNSAGSEVLSPSFTRQIIQNWTLDPLLDPERMEAIRAACQWALGGPHNVDQRSMSLLIRPEQAPPGPDRHFGVMDKLERLGQGWVCIGKRCDVPKCALYKANRGDLWVWVTHDGLKGLADFTLILQQIARMPINSSALFNLPPAFNPIVFAAADNSSNGRFQTTIQAVVNQSGQLVTDVPYIKVRIDDVRSDASLLSIISSSGAATVPH
jgi:hypothetical protein